MAKKPLNPAEEAYGTQGVEVNRNGYGIHVGTYLRGGLSDLTAEMARSLRDQLTAVLGDGVVSSSRVHFATAGGGKVTVHLENGWLDVASDWRGLEMRGLEIEPVAGNRIRVRERLQ